MADVKVTYHQRCYCMIAWLISDVVCGCKGGFLFSKASIIRVEKISGSMVIFTQNRCEWQSVACAFGQICSPGRH